MPGRTLRKAVTENAFTLVLLAAAVLLFLSTNHFVYAAKPGRLGPDFWPKTVLILVMIMCLMEIGQSFLRKPTKPPEEIAVVDDEASQESKQKYPRLLYLGSALTLGYVGLVSTLGFFLTTFLYLVAFMYVGRYRQTAVIWISSLLGTVFLVFIFVKVVYVSLPIGKGPFAEVTYLIYRLLSIQ
ncbi:tripartite tricarboxylate transporter TctB family protein [Desulforamulus ruminis]|uniref:DUF1468 domain-containing protein n=1 Tax=Desulforamulus ruminis (strain ATCC 23193 / DSM 2154 / NCIMB 8452 / DL) TaxID=696281 RepID=F6DQN6_DESRL|nr:tripartite tricarboxylate transporter TctB family protein [Desulforamulus ruminis]AEG62033.1 hypothetical protein Desru_3833 [Desulforamulus ruminis DSM 2154]